MLLVFRFQNPLPIGYHYMMNVGDLKKLLIIHKEKAALAGVALVFVFLVGGGLYLQKQREKEKIIPVQEPEQVTVSRPKSSSGGSFDKKESTHSSPNQNTGTYFLKPSPQDLLQQLADMENLNPTVVQSKYVQMPVLWPVYFFSFEQMESSGRLILDVAEDGFGVVVESMVSAEQFAEITQFERGIKVWIGGKIVAVDPEGTGTVYLETEYLSATNPAKSHTEEAGEALSGNQQKSDTE